MGKIAFTECNTTVGCILSLSEELFLEYYTGEV